MYSLHHVFFIVIYANVWRSFRRRRRVWCSSLFCGSERRSGHAEQYSLNNHVLFLSDVVSGAPRADSIKGKVSLVMTFEVNVSSPFSIHPPIAVCVTKTLVWLNLRNTVIYSSVIEKKLSQPSVALHQKFLTLYCLTSNLRAGGHDGDSTTLPPPPPTDNFQVRFLTRSLVWDEFVGSLLSPE